MRAAVLALVLALAPSAHASGLVLEAGGGGFFGSGDYRGGALASGAGPRLLVGYHLAPKLTPFLDALYGAGSPGAYRVALGMSGAVGDTVRFIADIGVAMTHVDAGTTFGPLASLGLGLMATDTVWIGPEASFSNPFMKKLTPAILGYAGVGVRAFFGD